MEHGVSDLVYIDFMILILGFQFDLVLAYSVTPCFILYFQSMFVNTFVLLGCIKTLGKEVKDYLIFFNEKICNHYLRVYTSLLFNSPQIIWYILVIIWIHVIIWTIIYNISIDLIKFKLL